MFQLQVLILTICQKNIWCKIWLGLIFSKVLWLLQAPGCEKVFAESQLKKQNENSLHFIVEVGPRLIVKK